MASELFVTYHFVMASKDEIRVDQWRDYFDSKFHNFVKKNFKILVLSGIHGDDEGSIFPDEMLLIEDTSMVNWLNNSQFCTKREEIDDLNVKFILVDLAEYIVDGRIDAPSVGDKVRGIAPNAILLTCCYDDVSMVNEFLTSVGMYANLILQEDRMIITGGRGDYPYF